MPTQKENPSEDVLFIVGIGASARGLDALTKLMPSLPD